MTIIKIALAILGAAAVAALVVWVVGGTVGTRLARRRDRREPTTEVRTWGALTQPDYNPDAAEPDISEVDPSAGPCDRYFITRPAFGWWEKEVSKFQFILAEGEFGWRTGQTLPVVESEPATNGFTEPRIISAWIVRAEPQPDHSDDSAEPDLAEVDPSGETIPAMRLDDLRALVEEQRANNLRQAEIDEVNQPQPVRCACVVTDGGLGVDPRGCSVHNRRVEPDPRHLNLRQRVAEHAAHLGLEDGGVNPEATERLALAAARDDIAFEQADDRQVGRQRQPVAWDDLTGKDFGIAKPVNGSGS